MPSGMALFNDSGTYAPTYEIGTWLDDSGNRHLFLLDGYAASAEAMQAASLAPILDLDVSLAVFSSSFDLAYDQEAQIMRLDAEAGDFAERLGAVMGNTPDSETVENYREWIREARDSGIELGKPTLVAEDFLPRKRWDVMALVGYMLDDPYSGSPGVETIDPDTYRVTVRLSTPHGMKQVRLTLRFMEDARVRPLVCNPLLTRFFRGEDWRRRAVKISDSGQHPRLELQTLCSEALEHFGENGIRLYFDHRQRRHLPRAAGRAEGSPAVVQGPPPLVVRLVGAGLGGMDHGDQALEAGDVGLWLKRQGGRCRRRGRRRSHRRRRLQDHDLALQDRLSLKAALTARARWIRNHGAALCDGPARRRRPPGVPSARDRLATRRKADRADHGARIGPEAGPIPEGWASWRLRRGVSEDAVQARWSVAFEQGRRAVRSRDGSGRRGGGRVRPSGPPWVELTR
ncbi:MAG: hypothetical protein R3D98_16355 [Candidatus Krumholzibacteriia bacterium]